MFMFEAIAIAYFTALAAAAPFARPRGLDTWRGSLSSAAMGAAILAVTYTAPASVRLWFAHGYLVAGYWLPALLVTGVTAGAFEAWLIGTERWWQRWRIPLGPTAAYAFELSYLLCYVLVPAAFIVVWVSGATRDVERLWTAVLAAGFACYGTLPWLIARPPRALDEVGARRRRAPTVTQQANLLVLSRVSHGHNTFPSGHVAVSIAAALMVLPVSRAAGVLMLVIAACIAAGATAGRYHYAIDVLLGAAIGVAASVLA